MTLPFDSSYKSSYIGGCTDKTASAGLNKTSSFLSQFAVRFTVVMKEGRNSRRGILRFHQSSKSRGRFITFIFFFASMHLKTKINQIRFRPWSVLVASNFLLSFLISFTVFHLPVILSLFLPAFY